MSTAGERIGTDALTVAGGALVGHAAVARSGMVAVGMVGRGAGIGAAAGPVGAVIGGLTFLAIAKLLGTAGAVARERAEVAEYYATLHAQALVQAEKWAEMWGEEAVEDTEDVDDRVELWDAVASFDAWLQAMFGDERPAGWQIWTSRVAVEDWLGGGWAMRLHRRDW